MLAHDRSKNRLYRMVRERGYTGSADHFRHLMRRYRPQAAGEAHLRLRTLAGEQGQVDWAHFGTIPIGRARRSLMAFVMVLSYSRHLFNGPELPRRTIAVGSTSGVD